MKHKVLELRTVLVSGQLYASWVMITAGNGPRR